VSRALRWREHLTLNIYWLGLNVASGSITPLILPYLVALFVPAEVKNTSLATIRVIGLAVAMLVQPMAGMLSDRSTHRWGRRRPYILAGTLLSLVSLVVVGASPLFVGSSLETIVRPIVSLGAAYLVLLVGIVLLQASTNIGQGALQGLIPDLVPEAQRGRSSGVKSVMELLPIFLVLVMGPLVDAGRVDIAVGIVMASFVVTMLITVVGVREVPIEASPGGSIGEPLARLVALTAIFVAVTRVAVWLVGAAARLLADSGADTAVQVGVIGLAGLLGMAGSIFLGVYLGAWVGIGRQAPQQRPFIWWVINRLLFLAAVGSIQGFAQYYLADVLHVPNAAGMTTLLLAVVAVFLLPSALGGGVLADRVGGRKRFVAYAGLIAAAGTLLLLLARSFPMVLVSGSIIGLGTGTFYATNWALGTDLAPRSEAGRYLGISNLAGAGAGIVGAGIGGPMADFFNGVRPGLGYLVVFAIYAFLFLLSAATITRIRLPAAG